nr:MAG TPA: hypothetical protein [Caudoviricetes sp.]
MLFQAYKELLLHFRAMLFSYQFSFQFIYIVLTT